MVISGEKNGVDGGEEGFWREMPVAGITRTTFTSVSQDAITATYIAPDCVASILPHTSYRYRFCFYRLRLKDIDSTYSSFLHGNRDGETTHCHGLVSKAQKQSLGRLVFFRHFLSLLFPFFFSVLLC